MITVLFTTESHFPVNRRRIQGAVTEVLAGIVHRATEVSVTIIGNRRMRQLNRTYRNVDAPTDVLSFPQNDASQKGDAFVYPPDDTLRLGDIVVSYPLAVVAAGETNRMVDDVVVDLVLHGLNHLLGIHHDE